jgi:hypothetical protein
VRSLLLPLAMSALTLLSCVSNVSAQQSYRLQRPAMSGSPDQNASFRQDSGTSNGQQNYSQSSSAQQNYSQSNSAQQNYASPSDFQSQQFVVRPSASVPIQPPSQPLFGKADALNLGKALLNGFVPVRQTAFSAPPVRNTPPLQGSASGSFAVASIEELKRISNRDVVIIIDKSGSMSSADCPSDNMPAAMTRMFFGVPGGGALTRWEWCQRQTVHVASQLQRIPGNRIKLVLFDSRVTEFNNVSINSISDIFNQYRPGGGTNATKALKTVFEEYFNRKKQFGNVKPMSVVFITDGAPSSPTSLKDLIVETSLKMNNPNEIALSFLQIGNDDDGDRLLPELDYDMVNEGARFDFISSRPFASVSRTGLLRALLDTAR